eukprot:837265-Rhodomonas_salina.2
MSRTLIMTSTLPLAKNSSFTPTLTAPFPPLEACPFSCSATWGPLHVTTEGRADQAASPDPPPPDRRSHLNTSSAAQIELSPGCRHSNTSPAGTPTQSWAPHITAYEKAAQDRTLHMTNTGRERG